MERQLAAYEAADRPVAAGEKKKSKRKADPLRAYAGSGILNLSNDVVEAMVEVGLKWGGQLGGRRTSSNPASVSLSGILRCPRGRRGGACGPGMPGASSV